MTGEVVGRTLPLVTDGTPTLGRRFDVLSALVASHAAAETSSRQADSVPGRVDRAAPVPPPDPANAAKPKRTRKKAR